MNKNKENQEGFTLIEMSMVLVVIGFLIWGGLLAQDLVYQSQIRSFMTQISKYNTVTNTFIMKYNGIPGDFKNAIAYGLGTTGGAGDNTGGSGTVGDGYLTSDTTDPENKSFWYHLSASDLLSVKYDGLTTLYGKGAPDTAMRQLGIYVGTSSLVPGSNVYVLGLNDIGGTNYLLNQYEAWYIDDKLDDGNPLIGYVRAPPLFSPLCYSTNNPLTTYYDVGAETNKCVIFVKATF